MKEVECVMKFAELNRRIRVLEAEMEKRMQAEALEKTKTGSQKTILARI